MDIKIAIDAMGGDFGPKVTVPAALIAVQRHSNLKLILVGKREALEAQLAQLMQRCSSCASALNDAKDKDRDKVKDQIKNQIEIYNATEEVAMDEPPVKALRFKKDSSMRITINLVKDGKAQAGVSAGNTGALMATAHYVLKTLPGIDRPAIVTALPTIDPNKEVRVLDLGANVDSEAVHLYQFAVMGSELVKAVTDITNPKIGLLNIGSEEIKGNEQVKRAAQLIAENKALNYIGYVEGDDIFKGDVDVVVCDGFIGNVTLKTTEGLAKLVVTYVRRYFTQNIFTKFVALLAKPILKKLARQLDPGRRNGATLIGLRGIVIKSHGGADKASFANAIEEAIREVEHNVPQNIQAEVGQLLQQ